MSICKQCNGTGYLKGFEHVQNGVCFKCNGYGDIEKAKEMQAMKNKSDVDKSINEFKTIIVSCYIKQKQHEEKGYNQEHIFVRINRENAKRAWDELKKLGIIMTMEEIESKVNEVKKVIEEDEKRDKNFKSKFLK